MRQKIPYITIGLAAAVALLAAACGSSSPSPSSSATNGTKGAKIDTTPVKVAFPDTPDVGDITLLAAMDMMRQQGYNINSEILNGNAVDVAAVSSGSAQIGNLSVVTVLKATSQGTPLTVFGQSDNNEYALVVKDSVKTVQQLNGQVVGLASPTTSTAALTTYTERTNHVNFKNVYVSSSSARATALLSGQIAGTPLELDDVAKILNGSPGKFHALVNYDTLLPWLLNNLLYASKSFAAAHKPILQALVYNLAKADQQAYANPTGFLNQYGHLLSGYTQAVLATTMQESVAGRIWGNNDQVPPSSVTRTLAFDQQQGNLTAAQVSNLKSTESSWFTPIAPSSP